MSYKLPFAKDIRNAEVQQRQFSYRLIAMGTLVLVCFGLLIWRWSGLQIVRHDSYIAQAENNRTALMPIVPSRGEIRDRNGIVLATNYTAYNTTYHTILFVDNSAYNSTRTGTYCCSFSCFTPAFFLRCFCFI